MARDVSSSNGRADGRKKPIAYSIFQAMGEIFTFPSLTQRFSDITVSDEATTQGIERYFNNVWGYLERAANDHEKEPSLNAAR